MGQNHVVLVPDLFISTVSRGGDIISGEVTRTSQKTEALFVHISQTSGAPVMDLRPDQVSVSSSEFWMTVMMGRFSLEQSFLT